MFIVAYGENGGLHNYLGRHVWLHKVRESSYLDLYGFLLCLVNYPGSGALGIFGPKMQAIIKFSNAYRYHIFPRVQVATNKNVKDFRHYLSVMFCKSVVKFICLSSR